MNAKYAFHNLFCIILLITLIVGCERNGVKPVDRKQFLTGIQELNLIPRFSECHTTVLEMSNSINTLLESPNTANLTKTKTATHQFYKKWKSLEWISFGPGKFGPVVTIRDHLSLWPIDTLKIDQRIKDNMFNQNDGFRETRGILSLEYLLHHGEDDTIIERLQTDESFKAYMLMISEQVKDKYLSFEENWNTYTNTFTNADGTGVTESTSLLYNAWLGSFENMKEMAILHPFGLSADSPKASVRQLEARHSQYSKEYVKANFDQFKDLFEGAGTDVKFGWKYYLEGLEGGSALATKIDSKIQRIDELINGLPSESFFKLIETKNTSKVEELAQELQALSPLIKGEMSSLMGVAITFSSSDGD